MKRFLGALFLAGAVAVSGAAIAHEGAHDAKAAAKSEDKKAEQASKPVTVLGEVVDTGCYLGAGEKGTKHKGCAASCISNGMPMGLLTEGGELYLMTPPHGNMDAYNKLKEWAAAKVEVTGKVQERSGMKSIEVASAKQAPATETKTQ